MGGKGAGPDTPERTPSQSKAYALSHLELLARQGGEEQSLAILSQSGVLGAVFEAAAQGGEARGRTLRHAALALLSQLAKSEHCRTLLLARGVMKTVLTAVKQEQPLANQAVQLLALHLLGAFVEDAALLDLVRNNAGTASGRALHEALELLSASPHPQVRVLLKDFLRNVTSKTKEVGPAPRPAETPAAEESSFAFVPAPGAHTQTFLERSAMRERLGKIDSLLSAMKSGSKRSTAAYTAASSRPPFLFLTAGPRGALPGGPYRTPFSAHRFAASARRSYSPVAMQTLTATKTGPAKLPGTNTTHSSALKEPPRVPEREETPRGRLLADAAAEEEEDAAGALTFQDGVCLGKAWKDWMACVLEIQRYRFTRHAKRKRLATRLRLRLQREAFAAWKELHRVELREGVRQVRAYQQGVLRSCLTHWRQLCVQNLYARLGMLEGYVIEKDQALEARATELATLQATLHSCQQNENSLQAQNNTLHSHFQHVLSRMADLGQTIAQVEGGGETLVKACYCIEEILAVRAVASEVVPQLSLQATPQTLTAPPASAGRSTGGGARRKVPWF